MNSQVDSNGDDCLDYQQLAGNINKNEESPEIVNTMRDRPLSGKSLGSASIGQKRFLKSQRSFHNSPESDQ